MASRFLAVGILGILLGVTAASSVLPGRQHHLQRRAAGAAQLRVFGTRSAQQRANASAAKFDASLADISRHLNRVRTAHALEDLQALNPAARFAQPASSSSPLVSIDAVTRGDPQQLKAALIGLGLQRAAVYANDVGGWLPVNQLEAATALAEVHSIRAAMSRTRSGAAMTQGDYAQRSDLVRDSNSLSGKGVTVGVISDSYNCYAQYAASGVPAGGNAGYANNGFTATASTDVSTGDLPSGVNVVGEAVCADYGAPLALPFGDEGRAMMQIVHDVAPGAALAFYTAENSEADFAGGIGKLVAAGAKVIAEDVGYFDEPFFQDGIVAQAINAAKTQGVAYFSAAGNNGSLAYDNTAPSFSIAAAAGSPNAGEHLLNVATTGSSGPSSTIPVTIPPLIPGEFVAIVVQWDQPYITGAPNSGGATSRIDLCVTGVSGNDNITDDNLQTLPTNCTGANALGSDPVQMLFVGNPANGPDHSSTTTLNIVVGLASGTMPGRIKVAIEANGEDVTVPLAVGPTLQGHPSALGAMAIGAAFYFDTPDCGTDPVTLEDFSALGGTPILFKVDGTRLPTAEMRQKPDFVGPDGVNNTFLGYKYGDVTTTTTQCSNSANYPNFFGTSAATPHVAGIAALLLEANPSLTPDDINAALRAGALPMTAYGPTPNFSSGYGFVQADATASAVPAASPAAPTLTLSATSITVGSSATLTWSSANNSGCTASGSWSGAQASNGTLTLSPATAGTYTYTLYCTNTTDASPPTSAVLTATAPPSSGGGGTLNWLALTGLAGLILTRRSSRNKPVRN